MGTMKYDKTAFVTLWAKACKEGKNATWVADQLGTSNSSVSQMAMRLRGQGVNLPKLWRNNIAREVRQLNRIVADVMKEEL